MTNFRHFQTERVCRRQFQVWRKWPKVLQTGRKHCGKREIARYEQCLLFPQCFIPVWITFCCFHQNKNCSLQTLSVWKSLKFVIWERVKEPWSDDVLLILMLRCIKPPFVRVYLHFTVFFRNICLSLKPRVPKKELLLLWQHECYWVYGHRMVNEVDFKRFRQAFNVSVKKEFADDEMVSVTHKPFPNDKFLDSFKLKEFADNNFKLNENGRKFSKPVENTVTKGEIAGWSISPLPVVFSKDL